MNTKPYDQAFKYLVEQDAESLLILLGALQPGEEVQIELLPREVSVAATLPDQPFRLRRADRDEIVHVEAQTYWEDDVPERMADYAMRLWVKYQLPITSYVLVLTKRGVPALAPKHVRLDAGDLRIRLRFRLIRLWQLSAQQALATKRESLLPFIPLMRGGKTELNQSAELLTRIRDERRQSEMRLHFLMLGGLRYNHTDILDLIGRTNMIPWEQLKESSFYQMILREGREEGLHDGELRGIREMLSLLAEHRFPGVRFDADLERIHDFEGLKKLGLELNTLPDAESLRQRLAQLIAESEK